MKEALVIESPEEAVKYNVCGAEAYGGFMTANVFCGKPKGHKGTHRGYVLDWPDGYCSRNWGNKQRQEEQREIFKS